MKDRCVVSVKLPKIEDVLTAIKECISEDRYTISTHALLRQNQRQINLADVLHVLKTGYEEKRKTRYENGVWKYAIRGKTKISKVDLRIIVTFEEEGILIITVMYVERL